MTARAPTSVLQALLARRLIFVAGKGGTGKTTVAAALALLGADAGKRVLLIEADGKGDLVRAFGDGAVGFAPQVIHRNISAMTMSPEEALQEYLQIFLKIPRLVRIGPLSKVLDFIATGVPGPKEMVVIGKIAYEERARAKDASPKWDLIVVDAMASGHVVSHLRAAREGLKMMQGGMLRGQLEWVDMAIRDAKRTTTVITSLPEEMSVVESLELESQIRRKAGVHIGACVINRVVELDHAATLLAANLQANENQAKLSRRLGGEVATIERTVALITDISKAQHGSIDDLRRNFGGPLLELPLLATRSGLATTRAVANALTASEQ